jgi:hypothetical protein
MATGLLFCYGLFVRIHSCFASLGILMVYNCTNTCLYALWSTLILDLMHIISFFSRFMFDEFIANGGEYGHKLCWTLANRVVVLSSSSKLVLSLSHWIKRLEFFSFFLHSHRCFLSTHVRCSMKCLRGTKCGREGSCFGFLMCLRLVVLPLWFKVSNPVLRTSSFSIAT